MNTIPSIKFSPTAKVKINEVYDKLKDKYGASHVQIEVQNYVDENTYDIAWVIDEWQIGIWGQMPEHTVFIRE